ncbi:sigma-54 dependent transcriptional regulator [Nitrosomonas sp.]|uniref:sigma-54-dependent transcriptional regulator n=1 Tax=Nitrosomonas sp. TaxID=42353 RepID=UPI00207D7C15|nr:sigma-54 dependent transcriptional regulator [Nitrosomonas sp.]GJL73914.1 MAG: sigma-54-dependent Fis family transcriptional regulator [Nitrosomonas sp.]
MKTLPVLIVEDDRDLLEAICATLRLSGYATLAATDGKAALKLLQTQQVGMVISDVQMQPMTGLVLLQEVKTFYPDLPVLLMTAYGEVDKAVVAMRNGACDYLLKPFDPDSLLVNVKQRLLIAPDNEVGMIAKDPRSIALLSLAKRVAKSQATVLITGGSGCGKEVLARFIHQQSSRSVQPFVAINCAAIPENLLEATMFGYEKGAFTGATQAQQGKFEQAEGGTLLLDEISEMPLLLQAKLLRVLQEREVERVGGNKTIKLNIRLLATSNRDLPEMVKKGDFREDLYYRLNVFPLEIPPLRERPLDIVPLVKRLLESSGDRPATTYKLSKTAINRLENYEWPGNIRELENVVQRAMILATGIIEEVHLNLPNVSIHQVVSKDDDVSYDMKTLEKNHIMKTLAAVNGSRKLAVKRLGISERTLRYKLQQYRLAEC